MYCAFCGKKLKANKNCSDCSSKENVIINDKKGSIGWFFLSLFFPVIGIILYFIWRNEKWDVCRKLLIGFFGGLALNILLFTYLFYFIIASIINSDIDFCEFECPNGYKVPGSRNCICPDANYYDLDSI